MLQQELSDAVTRIADDTCGAALFEQLFQPAVTAAEKNNAPLYCGEYGVMIRVIKDQVFTHDGIICQIQKICNCNTASEY